MRTTRTVLVFDSAFRLKALGRELPAGSYTIETDEELIEGLSFPAYRRAGLDHLRAHPSRRLGVGRDPAHRACGAGRGRTPPRHRLTPGRSTGAVARLRSGGARPSSDSGVADGCGSQGRRDDAQAPGRPCRAGRRPVGRVGRGAGAGHAQARRAAIRHGELGARRHRASRARRGGRLHARGPALRARRRRRRGADGRCRRRHRRGLAVGQPDAQPRARRSPSSPTRRASGR